MTSYLTITPFPDPERRAKATSVRVAVAELSTNIEHPDQLDNEDTRALYICNFKKGLHQFGQGRRQGST